MTVRHAEVEHARGERVLPVLDADVAELGEREQDPAGGRAREVRGRGHLGERPGDGARAKLVNKLSPAGTEMTPEQWQDANAKCLGLVLDGRAQPSGIKRRGADTTLLLILNAYHDVVNFTLPNVPEGDSWQSLIDTNVPTLIRQTPHAFGEVYEVTGRSFLLFALERRRKRTRSVRAGMAALLTVANRPFRLEQG